MAGEGTTTPTVLAQAIVSEGLRNLTAGANPMATKRGLEIATRAVVDDIRQHAAAVRGHDEIERVTTISPLAMPRSASCSPTPWTNSAARV